MNILGKIHKNKKHWLIEVPALDVMTQASSKKVAYKMITEVVQLLINKKDFKIRLNIESDDTFYIASENTKDLIALMLKRQRVKNQLSLTDMSERLHSSSKNAYAQYEQGRNEPSLSQIQRFLSAMNQKLNLVLSV